jgi:hypothetical protein
LASFAPTTPNGHDLSPVTSVPADSCATLVAPRLTVVRVAEIENQGPYSIIYDVRCSDGSLVTVSGS